MSALLGWVMPYLIAAGGALVAMFGLYAKGRKDGKSKAKERDNARSTEIENAADRARRDDDAGADPLGRLREAGRLRD